MSEAVVLRALLDSGDSHSLISYQAMLDNHLDLEETQVMKVFLADGSSVVS